MTCYERNLEYIKNRGFNVDFSKSLIEIKPNLDFLRARSGDLTFSLLDKKKKITFHSLYNPKVEATRLINNLEVPVKPEIIIAFGLGLGYFLPIIRQKFGPEVKLIVIEPDVGMLSLILEHIELAELFDDNSWLVCTGEIKSPLQELEKHFQVAVSDRLQIIEHPVYARHFASYLNQVAEKIRNFLSTKLCNIATLIRFNETWLANTFENITPFYNNPGVKNLANKFAGFPAIIVAAGPSLDKNIDLLSKAKNKAVIICVGTALKAMLKKNILPDMVVSIDASELNYKHFQDIEYSNIPLVFDPMLYPEIAKKHQGLKFIVNSGNNFTGWLENFTGKKGLITNGGSVATTAFGIAIAMGANPIIMVGQDCAYLNDRTHANGTTYEGQKFKNNLKNNMHYFEIPGYYGKPVSTSRTLFGFLKWFEDAISLLPGKRVINATEGGALIKGTLQMPLQEAIDQYCIKTSNVSRIIKDSWQEFKPQGMTQLQNALENAVEELQKIDKLCTKGQEISQKLLKNLSGHSKGGNQKLLKGLDKIDAELKKKQEYIEFMNQALQEVTLSVMSQYRELNNTGEQNLEKMVELSLALYKTIGFTCKKFEKYFRGALNKLQGEVHNENTN